ncbi:MAG: hypothetical protein F4Z75_01285 [Synechococcus sp. SB0668_bin_15]|nr:hypothetical protein [Synechococcus sp. SB0668_bin_15]MYC50126.1 hypothetical protein [Synechococcus sp. SB0662_bin_14]
MVFSSHQRSVIRQRAGGFARRWSSRQGLSEEEHAEIFIYEFFGIFDIDCYLSNIDFEYQLPSGNRIDVFWPGVILIENKRPGEDLHRAFEQARNYYQELEDYLKPKYILVNNFCHFRISSFRRARGDGVNYWDEERRFSLNELSSNRNISLFYYFADHKYVKTTERGEQPVEKIVKETYTDKPVDEKLLETLIEHKVKKFMHKTKYSILKLAVVSSVFLALGYLISDGQPRAWLESVIGGSTREESTR